MGADPPVREVPQVLPETLGAKVISEIKALMDLKDQKVHLDAEVQKVVLVLLETMEIKDLKEIKA